MSVQKWSVRLEGLPWKWVRADHIFKSMTEIRIFAEALSKDAPHVLSVAVLLPDGYNLVNADISAMIGAKITDNRRTFHRELNDLYVPLGFALDVEEWRAQFVGSNPHNYGTHLHVLYNLACVPQGHWEDFADLTCAMDEGGDQGRWYSAHFVGPSWWVVPFPELPGTE